MKSKFLLKLLLKKKAMNIDNNLLNAYIEKIRQGINPEGTELDFKREWWDFNTRQGVEEYVKDICSMSNTAGGDCYIIIGVDEKTGMVYDSPLPMDESKLQDKHKNEVQPLLNISFHEYSISDNKVIKKISVVEIPHSLKRPHVITRINSKPDHIPIRLGTQVIEASRTDLDVMYSDRGKISQFKVRLLEKNLEWGNFAIYTPAFLIRVEFDNHQSEVSEYVESITLVSKTASGDPWKTLHFKIEEKGKDLGVDSIFEIEPGKIKQVTVFLSEKLPQDLKYRENIPTNDMDQYRLTITTRRGTKVPPIKFLPGWIKSN
ncbi:ATP-binding protein [Candidatus Amesbacteria bacterium]|nr:ATP-binding protein [Candidatus Amesbacteria bacterium]